MVPTFKGGFEKNLIWVFISKLVRKDSGMSYQNSDIKYDFTKAQKEAITHTFGPCLVLAVPGAGKTTVLLERLRFLVENNVVSEDQIISITFSRQQAIDMKTRYESKYKKISGAQFSTIHAFCYSILKKYFNMINSKVELIEGSEKFNKYHVVSLLFNEINNREINEDELENFFRIDGYCKNALISYEEYTKKLHESFVNFKELSLAYSNFKSNNSLIDFDDMLIFTLKLLNENENVLESLRKRFKYIQVDEAQDTSLVQFRIIQLIAGPLNNVFMVADDDQAIYGFRGTDPNYLLNFKELYPNAKIITMEDNYRSSQNIVKMSASFIQRNRERYDKCPITDDKNTSKISILIAESLKAEYQKIAKELASDLDKGTVAILFRNNISMVGLMDFLDDKGFKFYAGGDGSDFYKSHILRDIIDILELAQDSTNINCYRNIYYKLNSYLKKQFLVEIENGNPFDSVWKRLFECDGTNNNFYRERIIFLENSFNTIKKLNISSAISYTEKQLGYGEYLKELIRRNKATANNSARVLETLKTIATHCDNLDDFRNRLKYLKEIEKDSCKANSKIVLSTIHGAKGLEYSSVWLIDLIQGELPTISSLDSYQKGTSAFLEEERRLFYVAMTRAKNNLRLIGRTSVNGKKCEYSQFLNELMRNKKNR